MKAINFVLSVFFFTIGIFAIMALVVAGITACILVASATVHEKVYPLALTTIAGMLVPSFFIGLLAFYSLEFAGSQFNKSRKLITAS